MATCCMMRLPTESMYWICTNTVLRRMGPEMGTVFLDSSIPCGTIMGLASSCVLPADTACLSTAVGHTPARQAEA